MANRILFKGKICDTQYEWNGKTVEKLIWLETGKECVLKPLILATNTFTGTFSSQAKEAAFMAITTSVADNQFDSEASLTSISMPKVTTIGGIAFSASPLTSLSLPEVTTIGQFAFISSKLTSLDLPKVATIGDNAFNQSLLTSLDLPEATTIGNATFYGSKLTSLDLPKVTAIGDSAFNSIVNLSSTSVTMNKKFNTNTEKDRIFGAGHWNHITFQWLNDDGTVDIPPNAFTGTFSTPAMRAAFMGITTSVADNQFKEERGLTSISLPEVTTIGNYAFYATPLTSLSLPKVTVIKTRAFMYSKLTSLDLPEATTIGEHAFQESKLTSLSMPKVTTIDGFAFLNIVNAPSTTVTLKSKFNTSTEKDRIFGFGNWTDITFTWV